MTVSVDAAGRSGRRRPGASCASRSAPAPSCCWQRPWRPGCTSPAGVGAPCDADASNRVCAFSASQDFSLSAGATQLLRLSPRLLEVNLNVLDPAPAWRFCAGRVDGSFSAVLSDCTLLVDEFGAPLTGGRLERAPASRRPSACTHASARIRWPAARWPARRRCPPPRRCTSRRRTSPRATPFPSPRRCPSAATRWRSARPSRAAQPTASSIPQTPATLSRRPTPPPATPAPPTSTAAHPPANGPSKAYLKAPNSGEGDRFGAALSLSFAGDTLAVGARFKDSSATGAFHPGDPGYAAVLADTGGVDAGAAYVYRRSAAGRWAVEAYVKAPNSDAGDFFGAALALSEDGAALAVGAPQEDSSATRAFHPGDSGYAVALASNGPAGAGAAYLYRRDAGDRWAVEAYLKATELLRRRPTSPPRWRWSGGGAALAVGRALRGQRGHRRLPPGRPRLRRRAGRRGRPRLRRRLRLPPLGRRPLGRGGLRQGAEPRHRRRVRRRAVAVRRRRDFGRRREQREERSRRRLPPRRPRLHQRRRPATPPPAPAPPDVYRRSGHRPLGRRGLPQGAELRQLRPLRRRAGAVRRRRRAGGRRALQGQLGHRRFPPGRPRLRCRDSQQRRPSTPAPPTSFAATPTRAGRRPGSCKAANADAEDFFGCSLALSGDGSALLVGAGNETGDEANAAGAFHPGGADYESALASNRDSRPRSRLHSAGLRRCVPVLGPAAPARHRAAAERGRGRRAGDGYGGRRPPRTCARRPGLCADAARSHGRRGAHRPRVERLRRALRALDRRALRRGPDLPRMRVHGHAGRRAARRPSCACSRRRRASWNWTWTPWA